MWLLMALLFLREMKENNGLLKEEVEGLQRKLERYEKVQASLVALELENEVRSQEHLPCINNQIYWWWSGSPLGWILWN